MQTRWTAVLVTALALPAGAVAAPLDQAACDALKTERAALVAAGIENDVARGPEWAKSSNLGPDRLKQIERMIEVDEQLSFRCGEAVTARPTLKEPPKPVETAVTAKKEAADQAATLVSPSGDVAPAKKKKKPATAKNKQKRKDSAAAAGGLPALSP